MVLGTQKTRWSILIMEVSRCLHPRAGLWTGLTRMNGMLMAKPEFCFLSLFSRLIPTKPELMRPTNAQQRCWGVVKCTHLCSLPNAVRQNSTFMLFSWYYLVGLHTYTHQFIPTVNVVLCRPSSSPKHLCVFCSFRVSFFPKVVYSGCLVALTSYIDVLSFIFPFLSSVTFAEWQQLRNAQCAVDSFNTQYCSCKTVTFHRATATVILLGVRLWNSQNLLSFHSSSAIICLYDFMIRQCGIT